MKIFFSYPHDANAELVRRFRDDLNKLDHEVWFDESEIKAGDDWRDRITRGIVASERAVALPRGFFVQAVRCHRRHDAVALGRALARPST